MNQIDLQLKGIWCILTKLNQWQEGSDRTEEYTEYVYTVLPFGNGKIIKVTDQCWELSSWNSVLLLKWI